MKNSFLHVTLISSVFSITAAHEARLPSIHATSMVHDDDGLLILGTDKHNRCLTTRVDLQSWETSNPQLKQGLFGCTDMTNDALVGHKSSGEVAVLWHSIVVGSLETSHADAKLAVWGDHTFIASQDDHVVRLSVDGVAVQDYMSDDDSPSPAAMELSSVAVTDNGKALLMVGYTQASGAAFGGAALSQSHYYRDSFMTLVDPITGAILKTKRFGQKFHNAMIYGTCSSGDEDEDYFYITGKTDAFLDADFPQKDGAWYAFLAKINAHTLETEWIRQAGATHGDLYKPRTLWSGPELVGSACAISDDRIFMAGTIVDGAVLNNMEQPMHSSGKNDVFVAEYDDRGNLLNAQQLGTDQDDTFQDMVVVNGHAVVLGNHDVGELPSSSFVWHLSGDECRTYLASDLQWRLDCDTPMVATQVA